MPRLALSLTRAGAGAAQRRPVLPACGFTLVEITVVLVIIGLLLSSVMVPLTAQFDQRHYSETQQQMNEIRDALLGYAASHSAVSGRPFLPCPDSDNDGVENRTGNACTAAEGRLPWVDLGVGRQDSWGNNFRYRVTADLANNANGFGLAAPAGTLRVCEDPACNVGVANTLPAVVVSHGKNGAGALNAAGGTNPAPAGADEQDNQDGDNTFVFHVPRNVAGNEFDDLVTWISPNILYNRMISAARLP